MFIRGVAIALLIMLVGVEHAATGEPATVAQVAEKLDLVTLPVPEGAVLPGYRREARLSYNVKQPAKAAFDFVDKQLVERGWKQMAGAQNYGDFVSADYQHGDFLAHLSASPGGDGASGVTVIHKGNVALEALPVPANAEKLYAFTSTMMYKSPDPVKATAAACEKLMTDAGWAPYGSAGDTRYYRKNAILAHVRVMSAPGQGGATVINLSTEVLSLELPAPPFADGFRYSDGTTAIMYDCDKTQAESAAFYRQALPALGWTATTDKPVEIRWKKLTIFRNDAQEMITVSTHEFEGRTRTKLDHQNVAEVARDELLALSSAGEKAKYRDVSWLPVKLPVPAGSQAEQLDDWAVKIRVDRGDAFSAAESLVAELASAGWTDAGKKSDAPHYRTTRLEGQDRVLHVLALDPPKRDAWVTVIGVGGVKFEPTQ